MEQKYEIGDSVVLLSGGPRMTITGDRFGNGPDGHPCFDGYYRCTWRDENNVKRQILHQDTLKLVATGKII